MRCAWGCFPAAGHSEAQVRAPGALAPSQWRCGRSAAAISGDRHLGTAMPDGLRRYLVDERAAPEDSLLIRVVGGEDGTCEAWFESRSSRDVQVIKGRNRELADAAQALLRRSRSTDVHIWDLIVGLLARRAYHTDVAPDPLENVLSADPLRRCRIRRLVCCRRTSPPALRVAIRQRQQDEARLSGRACGRNRSRRESHTGSPDSVRARLMVELNTLLGDQSRESLAGASARVQSLLAPQRPHRPVRVARAPETWPGEDLSAQGDAERLQAADLATHVDSL